MATVTVSDHVIWAKHVHGDRALGERIRGLFAGQTIELVVDHVSGAWRKMEDGADGRPTPGIRPLGSAQEHWGRLFRERRGEVVSIGEAAAASGVEEGRASERRARLVSPPLARSEAERAAAFRAFLELAKHGYRSEGPYGPRDELHERD